MNLFAVINTFPLIIGNLFIFDIFWLPSLSISSAYETSDLIDTVPAVANKFPEIMLLAEALPEVGAILRLSTLA